MLLVKMNLAFVLPSIPSMLWLVLLSSVNSEGPAPPLLPRNTLEMLDTLGALFLSQMPS